MDPIADWLRVVELGALARERELTLDEEGERDYLMHRLSEVLTGE